MGPLGKVLNKVLFPVGERAVISRIIELFPLNTEFIIMTHHLENQIHQYLQLIHPHRQLEIRHVDKIVGPGAGPGYSCLQAEKFVSRPFFLVCGDTLWRQQVPMDRNQAWLGISEVPQDEYSRFCMAELDETGQIKAFLDKKTSGHGANSKAFNGLAYIHNPADFFQGLRSPVEIQGEIQLSAGFQKLLKSAGGLRGHLMPDWEDVGTLSSYQNYLGQHQIPSFLKNNNVTYFSEKRVIKFFANPQEAERRALRTKVQASIFPPDVQHHRQFLTYQYVEGETFYVHATPENFASLLHWLRKNLWQDLRMSSLQKKKIQDFFQNQLRSRLAEYEKINPQALQAVEVHQHWIDPEANLAMIPWEKMGTGWECFFHGDLQFSNIISAGNSNYYLIDWRDELAGDLKQADLIYDLAKLNLGLELNLEAKEITKFQFSRDLRRLTLSPPKGIFKKEEYKKILRHFIEELKIDFMQIEIATGLLMLNMAGVHEESFAHWIWYTGHQYLQNLFQKDPHP